jgi:Tat protein translocase TatB subunit
MLVGLVALILLGPRKLPEMARKAGKIMAEFRGTANEFRETWQREVNFEDEAKALDINALEAEPVKRVDSISASETETPPIEPSIKEVDPAKFEHLVAAETQKQELSTQNTRQPTLPLETADTNDKKNWL